jgi:hypothetical protein
MKTDMTKEHAEKCRRFLADFSAEIRVYPRDSRAVV